MDTNHRIFGGVLILIVLVIVWFMVFQSPQAGKDKAYSPDIKPENFTSTVDNPYFALVPGTRFTYEAKKTEGTERIEISVLSEIKKVMGVETRVVRDQVFLNDSLVEDTLDWYAQDKEGNVWYFGEDTAEYEDGVITSHHGAWEAGVDGALPGIVMKARPGTGDSYYQEYYAGVAEDRADVLSVNETVTVPQGTFSGCVKTFDYTPLDPKSLEHKYYCKEIGFTALEVHTTDNERTELISVEKGVQTLPPILTPSVARPADAPTGTGAAEPSSPGASSEAADGSTGTASSITEAQAKAIALTAVPGNVTAVTVETRLGTQVYVVEVAASSGVETDVIVDMQTGVVLDKET